MQLALIRLRLLLLLRLLLGLQGRPQRSAVASGHGRRRDSARSKIVRTPRWAPDGHPRLAAGCCFSRAWPTSEAEEGWHACLLVCLLGGPGGERCGGAGQKKVQAMFEQQRKIPKKVKPNSVGEDKFPRLTDTLT